MRLHKVGEALRLEDIETPRAGPGHVAFRVTACGVCRTDLHILDGDLPLHRVPLVLGHEIVGVVTELGHDVENIRIGDRIGVPWMGGSCGSCPHCLAGRDNLCDRPVFTGYDVDGGYAEYGVARATACIPIPTGGADAEIAPLLCAGLIGFRAYRKAGWARHLGLVGFGAAAHIVTQVAIADGVDV